MVSPSRLYAAQGLRRTEVTGGRRERWKWIPALRRRAPVGLELCEAALYAGARMGGERRAVVQDRRRHIVDEAMIREAAVKMNRGAKVRRSTAPSEQASAAR